MKMSKFFSILLLLSFVVSPLFGGVPKAEAQPAQTIPVNSAIQVQSSAPNDEFGTSNSTGQMRTTTMAMRIAAALHLTQPRGGSANTYAGINPDTANYSPLAKVGGELAKMANMVANLLPQPDYFGVANYANSAWPQLDTTGAVIPGTGIRKFIDTLPGICGQPGATNSLGQCIPLAIADTTTFPGSDYYEIAVVEYREEMSPDLPAPGTKLRGYVQIVPSTFPGAVPLDTAHGLTTNILDPRNGNAQVYGAYKPHYLGPMIVATGCSETANPSTCHPIPVRVKFTNYLPTGPGGALFIPTDTTYMGAGMGPGGSVSSVTVTSGGAGYTTAPAVVFTNAPGDTTGTGAAATATVINGAVTAVTINMGGSGYTLPPLVSFTGGGGSGAVATSAIPGQPGEMYTQNRATLHLHGGNTPWISDGTPHQWTTPYGELTSYSKGESVAYVPDMWFDANGNVNPACSGQLACPGYSNDPGLGSLTFYWTNQQSGRLLFYHDHSYGTTRLNVYAGEAAGYLIVDPTEEAALLAAGVPGTLPSDIAHLIPLVLQDKTFVPDSGAPGGQMSLTDPTWDFTAWGGAGDLWFPHVYTPNQNPADVTGANAYGRWDYGAWFWPPQDPSTFVMQPYQCTSAFYNPPNPPPAFPPLMCPGIPNPSGTPEGFMDTPVINGALYPTLTVDPTSYRFQMLMAGNDRTWNLGLYVAEPLAVAVTMEGSNYTLPPLVSFTGGNGSGATAVANMSNGSVTSILLTTVGSGYTLTPNVTISGNGTGATAVAVVDPITTSISAVRITNGGFGYSSATVTIDPPLGCTTGCLTATAQAFVTPPGSVVSVTVTNPGSGYTSNPTVVFTNAPGDTTGSGAAAIASINSEIKMVESAPPETGGNELPLCQTATQTSGAQLALATLDANGNPINGTGLPAGCWPTTWPTDGRDGGVPDPLSAGPPFIQIGTESGLLPAPVVIPSTPVGYEYNRRSITVLNVYTHGLLLGPAERADVLVDFSQYAGKTLLLYNDAPAPVPAFDSRTDYYTGDPDQTMAGGAPSTLPGYGPNTRTIMQIKVNAVAGGLGGPLSGVTVTSTGAGYTAPAVAITGGGGSGATATAMGGVTGMILTNPGKNYTSPIVTFSGGNGSGAAATANVVGGVIVGFTITNPGSGYTSAPAVTITDSGPGNFATASATINVSTITLTAPGSGYTSLPVVTVSDSGGIGSGAIAVANMANGTPINLASVSAGVTGLFVTQQNQMIVPEPQFPVGNGNAAAPAYARISDTSMPGWYNGQIGSLVLTNGGQGYSSAPSVSLTGGGGTGATAALTFLGANVNTLTLTAGGSGYTSAPSVAINGGGGTGATASATISNFVSGVAVTNAGSGYTSAPSVIFTGGGGSGAAATAAITNIVNSVTVSNQGSGYTSAPTVAFTGGGGSGAAATANFTRVVNSLTLSNGGTGYNTAPTVVFTGGGGTGAAATATITKYVNAVAVTNQGRNYTSPPTVVFTGGGGSGAAATAVLQGTHIISIIVTNGGSGYTSAPVVTFTGGGGTGATATATITGKVVSLALTNGGSGYTTAPAVSFSGGGGTGAVASATITGVVPSVTVTAGGSGYTSAPTVSFTGGGGTGAAATANLTGIVVSVTMTNFGTLYTSAPTVSFSGGGGTGAAATASISGYVNSLLITNAGTGYTSNPTVSFSGGGGTGAAATATYLPGFVASLVLTNSGTGYTSAPTVVFSGGGTPTIAAAAYALPPVISLGAKAIQELFTLDYGRMNATLGVELPFTNFFVQTTIPYGFIDPPTEMFQSGDTIFWKITHNGVDTHFIHFHLYDVQVINRVGWDGMIKPPDVNEVAWKDTVRMNPLEDIIVALRPMKQHLPWTIPNSMRPMDVTQPIGASNAANTPGFADIDPANNPAVVNNDVINFGWEYVVHCHILGHEENDMMRPVLLAIPPDPPTSVNAVVSGPAGNQIVTVTWVDGSYNETGFTVQRATTPNGPWLSLTPASPPAPGTGTPMTFIDSGMPRFTTFYYQVVANDVVGYPQTYAAPAIGYPTLSADSTPVAAPLPITIQSPTEPGPIFADSFETGLNMWSGVIGNSNVIADAVIGPNGGKLGMVSTIDPEQPAYVYDTSPDAEVMYDANFYFNPHTAVTDGPVDIFLGLDQHGQPVFGVQYQYVDANTFMLRAWFLSAGSPVFTSWDVFSKEVGEDDPMVLTHKINVGWTSGVHGGFTFYIDENLFASLGGDTSAYQLEEVVLGPSLGLSAGDSGSMYFDEFTSSRLNSIAYRILLPAVDK